MKKSRNFEIGKIYDLATMIKNAFSLLAPLNALCTDAARILKQDEEDPTWLKRTIEEALRASQEFKCDALTGLLKDILGSGASKGQETEESRTALRSVVERNGMALMSVYFTEFKNDRFLYLDNEEIEYYRGEGERAFAKPTLARYPTIKTDISSAGRCIATQEFTACVFHLGRATEIVMQDLAKRRNISMYHPKQGKKPRRMRSWGDLLAELQKELDGLKIKSEGVRVEYNAALIASRRLKSVRNNTDHPSNLQSETYEKGDAILIWQLTKQFVEHSAKTFLKRK